MMTPGQEALREAARLESARVYGRIVPEHHNAPTSLSALIAEAELGARDPDPVDTAVRSGLSTLEICDHWGVTVAEVRAARKRVMSDVA